MKNHKELVERFYTVWRLRCQTKGELAKEIGIAINTLTRFLEEPDKVREYILLRIESWVEGVEVDYETKRDDERED